MYRRKNNKTDATQHTIFEVAGGLEYPIQAGGYN
jgi:hypothetical protein